MKNHLTRSAFSLMEIAIFFKIAPTYFHRGNEREEHGFHTISAQIVYPLQTLFPSCKIAIFCHIDPS